jgi:hypothetical protein
LHSILDEEEEDFYVLGGVQVLCLRYARLIPTEEHEDEEEEEEENEDEVLVLLGRNQARATQTEDLYSSYIIKGGERGRG